jgi:hypothetical protein
MTKREIQKEWERIGFETLENKPKIESPYPRAVMRMRELLLFAQVALGKVEAGENIVFNEELYQKTVSVYQLYV